MKLSILNTGYMKSKDSVLVAPMEGEKEEPKEVRFPILCFLIDHPEAGKILFDVGSHIGAMDGYWPEYCKAAFPLEESDETNLLNQLALCHTKPEDIRHVVLSHLHLDHAGNIELFPNADIYVAKRDYEHCMALFAASEDETTYEFYIRQDVAAIPMERLHLIDEDCSPWDGIELIRLPGHTPDLLGIVVHLENSGTMILPQDCIYTWKNYGPPARRSSLVYHQADFFASINKVRMLAEQYHARVVPAHDASVFLEFQTAPYVYE